MTNQQLTDFYNYTGLPFSNGAEAVRMLKKELLLELKASGNDALVIASKSYSKNDLIELFDKNAGQPLTVFDLDAFVERFPLMRKILKPETIFLPVELPAGLKVHPDYEIFCMQEVVPRFERYFQEVQKSLKANDLRTVAAQMIFLDLFPEEQQYKVQSAVKIMLRNKLELIKKSLQRSAGRSAIEEESYFMNEHFYTIVRKAGNDDLEFLIHQLHTAEKKIAKERNLTVSKTIYNFQYQLSFPEEIRVQIKANLDRFRQREEAFSGGSYSGESRSTGRIIWGVIVAMIFLVRILVRLDRNSDHTSPVVYPYPQIQAAPSQSPYDQMYNDSTYEFQPIPAAETDAQTTTSPEISAPPAATYGDTAGGDSL
jgi:hypothetical protein